MSRYDRVLRRVQEVIELGVRERFNDQPRAGRAVAHGYRVWRKVDSCSLTSREVTKVEVRVWAESFISRKVEFTKFFLHGGKEKVQHLGHVIEHFRVRNQHDALVDTGQG